MGIMFQPKKQQDISPLDGMRGRGSRGSCMQAVTWLQAQRAGPRLAPTARRNLVIAPAGLTAVAVRGNIAGIASACSSSLYHPSRNNNSFVADAAPRLVDALRLLFD